MELDLIVGLGAAVFAVVALVKRAYPKVAGWWAIALTMLVCVAAVLTFGVHGFATLPGKELDTWVADLLSVLATFTSSGVIHKAWSKLSV